MSLTQRIKYIFFGLLLSIATFVLKGFRFASNREAKDLERFKEDAIDQYKDFYDFMKDGHLRND